MVIAAVDAVDVREEDVSNVICHAYLVLNVERHLEVILPVLPLKAVLRNHRIAREDTQPVKICSEAIEHDDVGRYNEKVPRQIRIDLVELMVVAPRKDEAEHFRLAASRRHLDDIAHPCFLKQRCSRFS